VTPPRFRRHRNPDGRRPAFTGDFPPGDRDITEAFEHVQATEWDGTTLTLPGLRGQPRYTPAVNPADDYRRAVAQANDEAGPFAAGLWQASATIQEASATAEAGRLRAQAPGPDMFPALPPAPPAPAAAQQHDPRDTGPQQRLPRYARTAARPRPQRPADCAIFVWVPSISQHVLLCGMCRWRRHADPVTATMPFTFESLRQSAYITGWRLDAFTRWCCPACQGTAAYWSPRQVILWDGDALDAYKAGDTRGEFWHRARAERHLICDVTDAGHGKHAAATR